MRNPPFPTTHQRSPIAFQGTHSRIGFSLLRNLVHSGPSSSDVSAAELLGPAPPSITPKISSTCAECMTTVVVPAAVANSAAISLVDIPPVPRELPSVEVETEVFSTATLKGDRGMTNLVVELFECLGQHALAGHRDYCGGYRCIFVRELSFGSPSAQ